MFTSRMRLLVLSMVGLVALLVAACGDGARPPTPTRPPSPTATPVPATATPVPATATPVQTTVTATATPAPIATATPSATVPTPVVKQPGKRGGALQLRTIQGTFTWDAFASTGTVNFHFFGPLLNNLIWSDPYGTDLNGDAAEGWTISDAGKVITFRLRKGITYHDGTPLTSKDVAYNIDRGVHPRDTTMTQFRVLFSAISQIETPDDLTVKLTLSAPSNVMLPALASPGVFIYPAAYPFPERLADWQKAPIGSGPYKMTAIQPDNKISYVKNGNYFKPGMPYVDALEMTAMGNETAIAAFRAGKLDGANLDSSSIQYQLPELAKAWGFVPVKLSISISSLYVNQKPPFTNPLVRQALNLAMDRQALVNTWLRGVGTRLAPPLLPPELGGRFGIPQKEMETMPGYGEDKTADLAAAKALLKQAGVDPSTITINLQGTVTFPQFAETVDASLRDLGFKTKVEILSGVEASSRQLAGNFDALATETSLTFDDPKDRLAGYLGTGGPFNYGKWSNPKIDDLIAQEDREQDPAKRKQLILDLQRADLDDHVLMPLVVRQGYAGYMPWLKNYPTNVTMIFSNIFRWEQVWLDRG